MKTLLQVNTVVNSGSTGRFAEEIGQLAIKKGWKSYIAFGRHERPSQSNLIKIGSGLDINLHLLRTRLFDEQGLGSKKATQHLIKKIDEIKPDVIHLQNLHGYYLNLNVLFKYLKDSKIPVAWTFYDCWPFTGHCTYFDYVNCNKWQTACSNCPQKKSYPASYFMDRSRKNFLLKKELFTSLRKLDIISNSKWLGKLINHSFFKNYKVNIINSGIDVNLFKPKDGNKIRVKLGMEDKFIILGVASQWIPRKGLSDFLELSKVISNEDMIILIGLTSKQIRNLPSNIIGIRRTESISELAEWYSASNVFLNPTWEDNFPTTNMEALACGIPVITYKTGGSIESISEETGFIIEKGDLHGIMGAIYNIKKHEKAKYLASCRESAISLYDKRDRYNDYLNLFESLIKD